MTTVRVAVVGAGIAGMTAALRLLERGYDVTVYDRKSYVGGKFGAHTHPAQDFTRKPYFGGSAYRPDTYHEHCSHMLLNWYHNFWRIAEDIGLSREADFEPHTCVKYLRKGEYPRMAAITNPGSPSSIPANLLSGVRSIPDMFLNDFSVLDLLTQRFDQGGLLSRYSVNGFMQSRPYATEGSATLYEETIAKAFACPSYLTSARSYQAFTKYSFGLPDPMLWVLKGDCQRHFNEPLKAKLDSLGCRWKIDQNVVHVAYDEGSRTMRLESSTSLNPEWPHPPTREDTLTVLQPSHARPLAPTVDPQAGARPPGTSAPLAPPPETAEYQYVIFAVPPLSLRSYFQRNPELARRFVSANGGTIEKLHSEPIASLDLYLKTTLPDLPKEHVVLLGSAYGLAFIDHSRLWPGVERTALNVVAAEFDALADLPEETAMFAILEELGKYVPVTYDDVEYWHIEANAGDELFINEVGSHRWRPRARTSIPIAFLAGDYCQTFIDVVTVEGAIVSGLEAATALQQQVAADLTGRIRADDPLLRPIEIIEPDVQPEWVLLALKGMLAPYAVAAKCWSWANDQVGSLDEGRYPPSLTPPALVEDAAKLLWAPIQFGIQWWMSASSVYLDIWRRSARDRNR